MKFCLRLTFVFFFSVVANAGSPVTVVTNATVYTVDERRPVVSSFAYQDDKIIAVGNEQALLATYQDAQQLDLDGAITNTTLQSLLNE